MLPQTLSLSQGKAPCPTSGHHAIQWQFMVGTQKAHVGPCKMLIHVKRKVLVVPLCLTAIQAPLSVGFSRQESWSGLPLPSPGDLPDPGTELVGLTSPALAGEFFTTDLYSFIC